MVRNLLYILLLLSSIFFSCKKDRNVVTPNVGYSYAGLEVGKYVIFDVDSHHYNIPFNLDTTIQFQIKEVIDSKYIDLEGDEAFKIIRYRKDTDSTAWYIQDVWNAKLTATNFQKVEENIRFVKLIFPVGDNKTWNGNVLNNNGDMQYEYDGVHQTETIGTTKLDSVTTVLQFEDINLIQEKQFIEKFSAGIGMVYKKSTDVNNAFNNTVDLWLPDTGEEVVMTLASFGG